MLSIGELRGAQEPLMARSQSRLTAEIDFNRNGKQHGFIRLPYSVHRSAYGWIPIPVACIKNDAGPRILLMAGNHGDEYEGQVALGKLIRDLEPDEVSGRIIILPSANFPAAMAGMRTSPLDGGNLNRSFPGDPYGGPTEQIADYIERSGRLPRRCRLGGSHADRGGGARRGTAHEHRDRRWRPSDAHCGAHHGKRHPSRPGQGRGAERRAAAGRGQDPNHAGARPRLLRLCPRPRAFRAARRTGRRRRVRHPGGPHPPARHAVAQARHRRLRPRWHRHLQARPRPRRTRRLSLSSSGRLRALIRATHRVVSMMYSAPAMALKRSNWAVRPRPRERPESGRVSDADHTPGPGSPSAAAPSRTSPGRIIALIERPSP